MSGDAPVFTNKFSAEFNTSQDSLRQIAQHEWNIEMQFAKIYENGLDALDIPSIKTLHNYIVKIYADRLHAIMWTTTQVQCKEKEEKLNRIYDDWVKNNPDKVPITLIEELRLFKRWLYEIKQKSIKMGIPTKIERTAGEAVKKAIEGVGA